MGDDGGCGIGVDFGVFDSWGNEEGIWGVLRASTPHGTILKHPATLDVGPLYRYRYLYP